MSTRCGPGTRCGPPMFIGASKAVSSAIAKGAPRQITIAEARKIDKKYVSTATRDFMEHNKMTSDLQTIVSGGSGLTVKRTAMDILKKALNRILPFSD